MKELVERHLAHNIKSAKRMVERLSPEVWGILEEVIKDHPVIVLELRVAQSDMGKVIGKQGRIAKAIRSVVKAAASKEDKKVIVEIVQ